MKQINVLYGAIVDGELEENTPYYRYSNVSRDILQKDAKAYLDKLFPPSTTVLQRAITADTLIRLLQSADQYKWFITTVDPVNTYDTEHICKTADISGLSFERIYNWASGMPLKIRTVPTNPTDDPITTIQKVMMSIFLAE